MTTTRGELLAMIAQSLISGDGTPGTAVGGEASTQQVAAAAARYRDALVDVIGAGDFKVSTGKTDGTTAVTIVTAPSPGMRRILRKEHLTVYNADSAQVTGSLKIVDGTNIRQIEDFILNAGATFTNTYTIHLEEGTQSLTLNLSGAVSAAEPDFVASFEEVM